MRLIRIANKEAAEYQYQIYQNGWVLEIMDDFDVYYVAKVLTGESKMTNGICAVKKTDCEHLKPAIRNED